MKIVLLGYMASGKSAVGKLLAKKLGFQFIDLDNYIESKELKLISKIFNDKGEIYFRLKETEYLQELLNSSNSFILSLGGGTPCYGKNMELINRLSKSIYLKTSVHTLYERLKPEKTQRPLVSNIVEEKLQEFIGKHLFERAPFYEQSKLIVKTDNLTLEEIAVSIQKTLV